MEQSGRRGQVMLLTILALGGTLLGATTIAGLLMAHQIRQATTLTNSGKAFAAADAGVECALFQFFRGTTTCAISKPFKFANGSQMEVKCYDDSAPKQETPCNSSSTVFSIRALGTSGGATRALETDFR